MEAAFKHYTGRNQKSIAWRIKSTSSEGPVTALNHYPSFGMKRIKTILGNVGVVLNLQPTDIDPQLLKKTIPTREKVYLQRKEDLT